MYCRWHDDVEVEFVGGSYISDPKILILNAASLFSAYEDGIAKPMAEEDLATSSSMVNPCVLLNLEKLVVKFPWNFIELSSPSTSRLSPEEEINTELLTSAAKRSAVRRESQFS